MKSTWTFSSRRLLQGALAAGFLLWMPAVRANGGPFVVKYPAGDPAAKGVLARLSPDLKPGRETRLRVLSEDLSISFLPQAWGVPAGEASPPLVHVTAAYRIRNPLDEEIPVDFGFPILRGIYMHPLSMVPQPDVQVTVDGKSVKATILSNSILYGLIRKNAYERIERSISGRKTLAARIEAVREASTARREKARAALEDFCRESLGWNGRDAALLVEYASVDIGKSPMHFPWDARHFWTRDAELGKIPSETLGELGAIGERKATQLLAHLAGLLEPGSLVAYEEIFKAWGGDVRERSLDLTTGRLRPREVSLESLAPDDARLARWQDPAVYARVDYLDPNEKLSPTLKASLKRILKNLPVIFTFAPMNLLHYEVTFEPGAEKTVTVSYRQYAYVDTREPTSYQLAYVVHPASLWDHFGPIRLTIAVPEGITPAATVALEKAGSRSVRAAMRREEVPCVLYTGLVEDKTGELFMAVDSASWKASEHTVRPAEPGPAAPVKVSQGARR